MSRFLTIATVAAGLMVAGCGGDDSESDDSASGRATATEAAAPPETEPSAEPSRAAGTTIKTSSSDFGSILFDGTDQAIYLFEKETSDKSECYGECATAWPPVLTKGDPQAGGSVDASLLGTTKRDDGSTQVTYKGNPLYYYHSDPKGQVLCQNVEEFGGLWLVVKPSGEPVQGG